MMIRFKHKKYLVKVKKTSWFDLYWSQKNLWKCREFSLVSTTVATDTAGVMLKK